MAPFRKIGAMLAGTVQKLTSSAEKQIQTKLTSTGAKMEKGVAEGITVTERQAAAGSQTVATAAQGAAAPQGKSSRDLLLAGGVTIAALGSSFAFIAKTIASLKLHQALAVMAFGLGIVLIPVMLIAIYKLYRRNLSAILEAFRLGDQRPHAPDLSSRKNLRPKPHAPRRLRLPSQGPRQDPRPRRQVAKAATGKDLYRRVKEK